MAKKKKDSGQLTTGQVAKLMKLHPDTVRRRARDGKIPYATVNGKMVFEVAALRASGIAPWADQGTVTGVMYPPGGLTSKRNLTDVLFIVDCSGSMGSILDSMRTAIKQQLDQLRAAQDANNHFRVGSIKFGSSIEAFTGFKGLDAYTSVYIDSSWGMTALWGALESGLSAVEHSLTPPMTGYDTHAALVVLITDGDDNQTQYRKSFCETTIKRLVAGDRTTVVVNCPRGSSHRFQQVGIPAGNVREWDNNERGVADYAKAAVCSTQNYTVTRSLGQTSSKGFYANLSGDADKVAQVLKTALNEVTKKVDVERVDGKQRVAIRDFCTRKFGDFTKGAFFYELTEQEKVQPYKRIIVQDTKTGKFYEGWDNARQLLGLPDFSKQAEIKLSPGNLGEFKVFIQSTSVNRKLDPGTAIVRLQ